jgi:hypothetical protein
MDLYTGMKDIDLMRVIFFFFFFFNIVRHIAALASECDTMGGSYVGTWECYGVN